MNRFLSRVEIKIYGRNYMHRFLLQVISTRFIVNTTYFRTRNPGNGTKSLVKIIALNEFSMSPFISISKRSYIFHSWAKMFSAPRITSLSIENSWGKVVIGFVVIGAGMYCGRKLLCSKSENERSKANNNESSVRITLMEHEQEIMAMMPAVSTITKFHTSGSNVESYLRDKITEMIVQNPWLTGRLYRNSKDGLYLSYELTSKNSSKEVTDRLVASHFQVIDDFELAENLSFDELVGRLIHLQVNKGNDCVDKPDEVLFKVCLVKIKGRNEMVLVFSLSHVLGDGYTFYTLHNMLDRRTPVTALDAVRPRDFKTKLADVLGQAYVDWIHRPFVLLGLFGCSLFRGPVKLYIVQVDNTWVEKQKAAFLTRKVTHVDADLEQGAFVSTNDILTAWHNQHSQSSFALMACNLRNRVLSYTDNMAGNYENSLIYNTPSDGHTPEAIRRSLQTFRNASNTMPGVLKTLWWNGSLTTNWCSFYKQIDLSDAESGVHCDHIAHIPIVLGEDVRVWRECLVIFKLDAERTGLLIATRSLTPEFLENSGIGRVINSF